MSKKLIADSIRNSTGVSAVAATAAAGELIANIEAALKEEGRFTIPGFGSLVVRETKDRTGVNPKTKEKIAIKGGKTVRFKIAKELRSNI